MTFIDRTNEQHADVITEQLASGGFLVGVTRERDGKIAMTLVLVNVALRNMVINHVAVDGNKLRSTLNIFCDMMN